MFIKLDLNIDVIFNFVGKMFINLFCRLVVNIEILFVFYI